MLANELARRRVAAVLVDQEQTMRHLVNGAHYDIDTRTAAFDWF